MSVKLGLSREGVNHGDTQVLCLLACVFDAPALRERLDFVLLDEPALGQHSGHFRFEERFDVRSRIGRASGDFVERPAEVEVLREVLVLVEKRFFPLVRRHQPFIDQLPVDLELPDDACAHEDGLNRERVSQVDVLAARESESDSPVLEPLLQVLLAAAVTVPRDCHFDEALVGGHLLRS